MCVTHVYKNVASSMKKSVYRKKKHAIDQTRLPSSFQCVPYHLRHAHEKQSGSKAQIVLSVSVESAMECQARVNDVFCARLLPLDFFVANA